MLTWLFAIVTAPVEAQPRNPVLSAEALRAALDRCSSNPALVATLRASLDHCTCALALVESSRRALGIHGANEFGAQLAELGYSARELKGARRGLVELIGAAR